MYDYDGSCIYVKKGIRTKELNCFKGISVEKEFEMSVIELVDYGCIYRSQDSKFWTFFNTLELRIQIAQAKRKKLLMCGDWNLNIMLDNIRIQEIKNLLENYNLINIVRSPTKITSSSESLIYVIVTNKDNSQLEVSVADLGFSDHLAQVVKIYTGKGNRRDKIVLRRQLTNSHIEKFKNLLSKESGNEELNHTDVNYSLKAFMDIFLFCLETTIPYKRQKLKVIRNNRWLKMCLIN